MGIDQAACERRIEADFRNRDVADDFSLAALAREDLLAFGKRREAIKVLSLNTALDEPVTKMLRMIALHAVAKGRPVLAVFLPGIDDVGDDFPGVDDIRQRADDVVPRHRIGADAAQIRPMRRERLEGD